MNIIRPTTIKTYNFDDRFFGSLSNQSLTMNLRTEKEHMVLQIFPLIEINFELFVEE